MTVKLLYVFWNLAQIAAEPVLKKSGGPEALFRLPALFVPKGKKKIPQGFLYFAPGLRYAAKFSTAHMA